MSDSASVDVHVRPARRDDQPRMLELWERSVRATHHFLEEEDVEMLRPLVAEELASDAVDWWVLVTGELVVGFLGFANVAAIAFYEALGFAMVSRSPQDGAGRPFPIVHMRRESAPGSL